VCPLDQQWRSYYVEAMKLYAAEGFRVIWLEDDIRYHNHGPLDWGGCFCPLHVAAFNERAGTDMTWPQIMKKVLQAGGPHPWRGIWLDMWQETLLELIDECRRAIEPLGASLGLMSSHADAHAMEGRRWQDWWKALAGDAPPIHRPHFGTYFDSIAPALAGFIARMDQNRRLEPAGAEVGPEIDHCIGRWAMSDQQAAAQLCLAQVFGATNLNVTKHSYMGNLLSDDPTRADFLRRWKPTLNWLSDRFPPTLRSQGIGIVWREDSSRRVHLAGDADDWQALNCPSLGWVDWLAAVGFAWQCGDSQHVNSLAGPMAWAIDEDDLLSMLKGGLLLDGEAAHILAERGMGTYTGLTETRIATLDDSLHTIEQFNNEAFALRAGSHASMTMSPTMGTVVRGRVHPDAIEASSLANPYGRRVGHGAIVYDNPLGGRAGIVPYMANGDMDMYVQRAVNLRKVVQFLAAGSPTGEVVADERLLVQFLSDGDVFRTVVWNAGADPCTSFHVAAPEGWASFGEAFHMTDTAEIMPIEHDSGRFTLNRPLRQWERIVILQ